VSLVHCYLEVPHLKAVIVLYLTVCGMSRNKPTMSLMFWVGAKFLFSVVKYVDNFGSLVFYLLLSKFSSVLQAQFRFYWLQSKFSEQPQLSEKSKSNNKYPLVRVPFTLCTKENMESLMIESSLSFSTSLDGLLFYHKLGFYTPQVSPLVGWLKPFMLPEILNICVPEVYLQKRPLRYENIRQYLDIKHKPKVSES